MVVANRRRLARTLRLLATVAAVLGLAVGMAAAQQPARGGHLTVAQADEPPILDPSATTASAAVAIVHHNVLEGLVKVDRDGNLMPGLAESWTVAPDATEYVRSEEHTYELQSRENL